MGIYRIKPWFQRLLQPITNTLVKYKISPDWMTYGAIAVAILMAIFTLLGRESRLWLVLVAVGVPLRLAMNALDGQVSRALDLADSMGEVKNELGDRFADGIIFGALCFIPDIPLYVSVSALIITLLIGYVGILSKAVTGVRQYGGFMGKPDRMTAVAVGALGVALTGWWPWFSLMLSVVIVLGLITLLVRLRRINERR